MLHFFCQAIQDITRTYEIPPEEIVTLIYDKIDVNGEGKEPCLWPGSWSTSVFWHFFWCRIRCFRQILMLYVLLLVSSGELTLEEFISGAREHPDIMEMLTKMMDLSHVLEIIIKGQKKNTIKWGWRWWKRVLHMSDWEPSPTLNCAEWLKGTWLSSPMRIWSVYLYVAHERQWNNPPLLACAAASVVKGCGVLESLSEGWPL